MTDVVPKLDGFIHEQARLRLLTWLSVLDWADFTWLVRNSGLSRGNLSVQMTRLSEAGYVQIDKRFVENRPRTTYSLTPEGRVALDGYKRTMLELLDAIPETSG